MFLESVSIKIPSVPVITHPYYIPSPLQYPTLQVSFLSWVRFGLIGLIDTINFLFRADRHWNFKGPIGKIISKPSSHYTVCFFQRCYAASIDLLRRSSEARYKLRYEPHRDKTNKMACAPSKVSDQPGHPPTLIRVFDVRLKKARILSYPLSAQQRLIRLGGCPG